MLITLPSPFLLQIKQVTRHRKFRGDLRSKVDEMVCIIMLLASALWTEFNDPVKNVVLTLMGAFYVKP